MDKLSCLVTIKLGAAETERRTDLLCARVPCKLAESHHALNKQIKLAHRVLLNAGGVGRKGTTRGREEKVTK